MYGLSDAEEDILVGVFGFVDVGGGFDSVILSEVSVGGDTGVLAVCSGRVVLELRQLFLQPIYYCSIDLACCFKFRYSVAIDWWL